MTTVAAAPVNQAARMYCTVADIATRLDLKHLPALNLEHAIRAATARCEQFCNRVFTRVPATGSQTRHFLGQGMPMLLVDDLLSWTSVMVNSKTTRLAALRRMPFGKTPTTWVEYGSGGIWAAGVDVAISGVWGYSETVPWPIWDSVCVLVARGVQQMKIGYQDASMNQELGELVYRLSLPHDVREVWESYRRKFAG